MTKYICKFESNASFNRNKEEDSMRIVKKKDYKNEDEKSVMKL